MNIFEAIGAFFVAIFKGIVFGICAFFRGVWAVICWIAVMAVRYFFVYLPVLITLGFLIFWYFHQDGIDFDTFLPINTLNGYDWKLTTWCANWLVTNSEPQGLITLLLWLIFVVFKLALVIVVAVLETFFVYLIYGLIFTFIIIIITFILMIVVFFILPGASVVYSGIIIKNSDYGDRWFYILCTLLSLAFVIPVYIYTFGAL